MKIWLQKVEFVLKIFLSENGLSIIRNRVCPFE